MRSRAWSVVAVAVLVVTPRVQAQVTRDPAITAWFVESTERTILRQPDVRKDLELSESQIERLDRLGNAASPRPPMTAEETAALEKRRQEKRAELEKILKPEQAARLKQLMRQHWQRQGMVSLFRYGGVADDLSLNEDQARGLAAATKRYEETIRPAGGGRPPANERRELVTATNQEIGKLLTADQAAKLKELLGAEFQGEFFPTPTGRFGAGRVTDDRDASDAALGGSRGGPPGRSLRTATLSFGSMRGQALALLSSADVRRELKMSDEQIRKVSALPAVGRDDPLPSIDFLSTEQQSRLTQLTLQYAKQRFGPLGAFYHATTLEALSLTADQKSALETLAAEDRRAVAALGFRPTADQLAAANKAAEDKIAALLDEGQRTKLAGAVGAAFAGVLDPPDTRFGGSGPVGGGFSSSRFFGAGELSRNMSFHLAAPDIQTDLQFSDDQRSQVTAAGPRADETTLRKILTEAQFARAREIQLQWIEKRSGPAAQFLYKDVVDSLALTKDQIEKLQSVLQRAPTFGAALTDADRTALQAQIDGVLTAEQKEKLKSLYGKPFTGEGPTSFRTRAPRGGTGERPPAEGRRPAADPAATPRSP